MAPDATNTHRTQPSENTSLTADTSNRVMVCAKNINNHELTFGPGFGLPVLPDSALLVAVPLLCDSPARRLNGQLFVTQSKSPLKIHRILRPNKE